MTSEELRDQLNKQREIGVYDRCVKEYLRVKKLVADSGALTHDECCDIAILFCRSRGVFDLGPTFMSKLGGL